MNSFHFELETGNLYAAQGPIERAEAGEGPPNLVQLYGAGKLLLAEAVILEQKPEDGGIVPLPALLDVKKYGAIEPDAYEHLDTEAWTRDDYICYGRWLDGVTRQPGQVTSNLTLQVIRQACYLGIGSSEGKLYNGERFGSVSAFYAAVEAVPEHRRYAYDSWTAQQKADYAERVFLDLLQENEGRTSYVGLNAEINRRAKAGLGPSCKVYSRDGTTPIRAMTMNGYVDVLSMKPEDYKQWGLNFMRANGGRAPTKEAVALLSRTKRAPSVTKFEHIFNWDDYVAEVKDRYNQQLMDGMRPRLCAIQQEVADRELPADILKGVSLEDVVAVRAKWLLVNELFRSLDRSHKKVIARHVSVDQLREVIADTGSVDDDDIEHAAVIAGVKEDLWPEEEFMPYLKVPEELLA